MKAQVHVTTESINELTDLIMRKQHGSLCYYSIQISTHNGNQICCTENSFVYTGILFRTAVFSRHRILSEHHSDLGMCYPVHLERSEAAVREY
jgi:hypothetical protein